MPTNPYAEANKVVVAARERFDRQQAEAALAHEWLSYNFPSEITAGTATAVGGIQRLRMQGASGRFC